MSYVSLNVILRALPLGTAVVSRPSGLLDLIRVFVVFNLYHKCTVPVVVSNDKYGSYPRGITFKYQNYLLTQSKPNNLE